MFESQNLLWYCCTLLLLNLGKELLNFSVALASVLESFFVHRVGSDLDLLSGNDHLLRMIYGSLHPVFALVGSHRNSLVQLVC